MAINKDSNGYTFGFAILLVIVVGSVLTLVAQGLKPFQDANLKMKKQQDMLAAIGKDVSMKEAKDIFKDYVKKSMLITADGKVMEVDGEKMIFEGDDIATDKDKAFALDVKKQYKDWKGGVLKKEDMVYPVFSAEIDGNSVYILPMVGTGLWGPIWGYVSVQEESGAIRKIYGATFDHKTETPGLGAEISQDKFQDQFSDEKYIADENNQFQKITVTKGQGGAGEKFKVDGITGGTVTSKGVEEMMERTFKIYHNYFAKQ